MLMKNLIFIHNYNVFVNLFILFGVIFCKSIIVGENKNLKGKDLEEALKGLFFRFFKKVSIKNNLFLKNIIYL